MAASERSSGDKHCEINCIKETPSSKVNEKQRFENLPLSRKRKFIDQCSSSDNQYSTFDQSMPKVLAKERYVGQCSSSGYQYSTIDRSWPKNHAKAEEEGVGQSTLSGCQYSTTDRSSPKFIAEVNERNVSQSFKKSTSTSPYVVHTLHKSYKDSYTTLNMQYKKDTEYPHSLSKEISDKSNCITPSSSIGPISPISNKHIPHYSNESSSGDVSPISNKDGSLSPTPSANQPHLPRQNFIFEKRPCLKYCYQLYPRNEGIEKSEETTASLTHTKKSMCESKCNSLDESMPLSVGEMSGENINNFTNNGSQMLQEDSALRQFHLLDELEESDQEEGEIMASNSGESSSESSVEELPLDDIDEMLDEGLPEKFKSSKNIECPTKLRKKVVLEEKGHDHFDLLPEGWIKIIHRSGMPVYLHKHSRVCSMARPYYLGPGSTRNHITPLSAIPCLHYRQASEAEKKNKDEKERIKQSKNNKTQSEIELMSAEIETFEENKATQSLEASAVYEYCKPLFEFKTVHLMRFKSWADRRNYSKIKKNVQKKQRPTLPRETKLLKFPIQNLDGTKTKGEWIINPNGKSSVCILHEYVQHALKKHPKYQFKELENPATPYSASVFINDIEYGFGLGVSKKHAKVEAAKAALEVLIPGMKGKVEPDSQCGVCAGPSKMNNDSDVSIFDQINVEDPRVAEFCAKSTEPPPYTILTTCLNRNIGAANNIEIDYVMGTKGCKSDEYTMTVGNHKATVACRNKREGKQRAAQAILKALHPNITYWGSLLRMYGNRSIKEIKEKKKDEQKITQLQCEASLNQPNFAILNKLKTELLKLKSKREAVKAKGQFVLPEDIVLPSLSSTDLNQVNLSNK